MTDLPPLRVAVLPFTAGPDIRANAETISKGIVQAARRKAAMLVTPEACLTGYPTAGRADLEAVDFQAVAKLEDELAEQAGERGLALILGTGSRHGGGISDDSLACGAVSAEVRYRKRCLTPWDEEHYVSGSAPAVVQVRNWRIGLAICFDLRFPDIWLDLAAARCDAFCVIGHMAGPDPDQVKARIIPILTAARALEAAVPLVFGNTAAPDRWLDSGFWDARGLLQMSSAETLAVCDLQSGASHGDWYVSLHERACQRARRGRSSGTTRIIRPRAKA